MAKARLYFDGDNIGIEKEARIYSLTQEVEDKINSIPNVIDNTSSTSTTDALSANMGRDLQEQINNLAQRGRYLSTWNAETGLPDTNPQVSPYTYRAGDYYIVSNVGSGTNYRPHGSSYTIGVASQSVESEPLSPNDLYIYDGTQWILQGSGGGQSVAWGTITGVLSNQTDLQGALNAKQDTLTAGYGINIAANNIISNTLPGAIVDATAPSNPSQGDLWYDTTNDKLKTYDGTQWNETGVAYTAGTNIQINGTTISATDTKYSAGNNINISGTTINARDTEYEAGNNITITCPVESDMKGPCPSGFHIPSKTELDGLKTIMDGLGLTTVDQWIASLKIPLAGSRYPFSGQMVNTNYGAGIWSSTKNNNGFQAYWLNLYKSGGYEELDISSTATSYGYSLRPFKDEYVTPTSSWVVVEGTLGGAGIFRDQANGLISITSDGSTGYTIVDKNLGATIVFNSGDTLSETNCGKYYQWGNNYGFDGIGGPVPQTSSTLVNTSGYGPGNYYSSSTFITKGTDDWSSVDNKNLRGGVTQGTWQDCEHPIISAAGGGEWGNITGTLSDQTDLQNALDAKQDTLIAGTNIQISPNGRTISATDTRYVAGNNITIDANNVISAVGGGTTYTAGDGINIDANDVISNTGVLSSNSTYNNVIHLSQADYDALPIKDPNTLYSTPGDETSVVSDAPFGSSWDGVTGIAPSKNAVYDVIVTKQDLLRPSTNITINANNEISAVDTTYTAGANITIDANNEISAVDTTYTAGQNVQINNGVISAIDTTYAAGNNITIDGNNMISAVDTQYTAGANVQISPQNVISATDTTYTAGTGINIDANNVISNTQTSAEWGNIIGTLSDQTDLQAELNAKQDNLIAGSNIQIAADGKTISATDTTYTAGTRITIDANNVISADISGVLTYKGNVASASALPSSGQSVGDCWYAELEQAMYAWDGTQWNAIGGTTPVMTDYFHKINDDSDDIIEGSSHLFTTSSEKSTWNNKQDRLVAGANITINGNIISSAGTTYNAGDGISISGTTISNTKKFEPAAGGSVGQVLTKTANGYSWQGGGDGNVKLFTLSSESDLATAQDAYDWILAGKMAILKIHTTIAYTTTTGTETVTGDFYFYPRKFDATPANTFDFAIAFSPFDDIGTNPTTGDSCQIERILRLTLSGSTVTGLTITSQQFGTFSYLSTRVNYTNPYQPTYAGSPATKQYVDDNAFSPSNGGSSGQLLKRTASGYQWATVTGLFSPQNEGSVGQVLTKTSTGYAWQGSTPTPPSPTLPTYIGFSALTAGSKVRLNKDYYAPENTFETSTDGYTWNTYTLGTQITLDSIGDVVYFRNASETTRELSNYSSQHYRFSMVGAIRVSGDITSLLNKYGETVLPNASYTFYALFRDCNALVDASTLLLPATTLREYCYAEMFNRCTALTGAPALPADILARCCYESMFASCTSLRTAPSISATKYADYSCNNMFGGCTALVNVPDLSADVVTYYSCLNMFNGCTSLENAPALPAMTLGERCYESMFTNCTSLKVTPVLPARVLAVRCYNNMFNGCTTLVTPQATLPATTLADNCYESMYVNCRAMTSAPSLPATIMAPSCYYNMFNGCSSLTSIPNLPTATLASGCYAQMFQNCISLVRAPALPATALADSCYSAMFKGCTSLTNAPALPATTLKSSCYSGMFENCTSLRNAPALPGTIVADHCYEAMFRGCISLTSAPNLPATTMASYCYTEMFNGCTSLVTGPRISASTMADYCCQHMFSGCTGLTNIPDLAADIMYYRCCYYMFNGCRSLINAPDFPATTMAYECCRYMFNGCTSLVTGPTLSTNRMADYCCANMFSGCTSLESMPDIPATIMTEGSCVDMFNGCTALTSAPDVLATTLGNSSCAGMFANCTSLRTAPSISATTLGENCCGSMFSGCTSLVTGPTTLPATTLATNCYNNMFNGCTALTSAPTLPATTMANSCYASMFYGCISLRNAPALPATALANSCYSSMFKNCTSLTTSPALPAATTEDNSYYHMFEGCTGLTSASRISATTIKYESCRCMFNGCTHLTTAPRFEPTSIAQYGCREMFYNCTALTDASNVVIDGSLADQCCSYMFYNCDALTTPPDLDAMTMASSCYSYMFAGCESLVSSPALPATTLANNCYAYMFQGCTGLTSAPTTLPAVALADGCYSYMFQGCTDLASAPTLPATTAVNNCYRNMFENCTSLRNAPTLPATTVGSACYASMFYGCTSLRTAPSLPATIVANDCYNGMFYNCTSLATAPALPATTLGGGCYASMFRGCISLTRCPALPAEALAGSCYTEMFRDCTNLITLPELPALIMRDVCYNYMFYGCAGIKMNTVEEGAYENEYRLPASGSGIEAYAWNSNMFGGTGGVWGGSPAINTVYYTSNTIIPSS